MRRLDLLTPSFDDLGAQRVAINVANALKDEADINFIVFEKSGPFGHYLNPAVKIVALNDFIPNIPKIRVILRAWAYYNFARKRGTEIAISFSPITNFVVLFAKIFNKNLKTVIQAHDFPSRFIKDRENVSLLGEIFFKYFFVHWYNASNVFLTSTEAIKEDYIKKFGIRRDFFKVVRNPVNIDMIMKMSREKVDDFDFSAKKQYLIGAGRLAEQKNFKRLLDVFKKVKKTINSAELIVLGNGPLEKELREYAALLDLKGSVHFLGFKNNPDKYIAQSNCFCLTSNWEALPQIIAEAMVCQTIVVANDCEAGPSEMIKNGATGFLVEYGNLEAFAERVIYALKHPSEIKKIEANAFAFAKKDYSLEKCAEEYKKIISQLS